MDSLTSTQQSCVEQFRSITGIEDREDDVVSLLTINNFDLNSSLSSFFDHGFDSIASASGAQTHEDTELHHRGPRRSSEAQFVNLQSSLFEESLLPRLPKAPKIGTAWAFEVGIHNSKKPKRSPWSFVWVLLLFIPRGLLQLLWRFLGDEPNAFPREFDYTKRGAFAVQSETYYEAEQESIKESSHKEEEKEEEEKEEEEEEEEEKEEEEEEEEKGSTNGDLDDPRGSQCASLTAQDSVASQCASLTAQDSVASQCASLTAQDSVASQFATLTAQYNLFTSSFNSCLTQSQQELRFFLVILSDSSTESSLFSRGLLANGDLRSLLGREADAGAIVYGNNVDTDREAYEVGLTYSVRRTPYVMLIANVSNNPSILASMSVLFKSNVVHSLVATPEARASTIRRVVRSISKAVETYNPQLVSARFDKEEIEFARLVKQQQDDAYLQSLERDRIKRETKQRELERQEARGRRERIRLAKLNSLVDGFAEYLEQKGPSKVRVAIKLPSGDRHVVSLGSEVSLNELYLYVEVLLYGKKDAPEEVISNEDYFKEYTFGFEVFQPMPRRVIDVGDKKIGEVEELRRGGNLLVEYTDEDIHYERSE